MTTIQKLSALAKRFFSKELKTLYKAGYVDGENELTDAGREVLEVLVLEDYMEQLVIEAEKELEEAKEEE